MFHYKPAKSNTQKKDQKESYLEYIQTTIERSTAVFVGFPEKFEGMMVDNIDEMRRDFRRIVRKIRGIKG